MSEENGTMRRFFYHKDLGKNFFALFKIVILQFFTMLQDKLHSFNQSRTIGARASFAQQI